MQTETYKDLINCVFEKYPFLSSNFEKDYPCLCVDDYCKIVGNHLFLSCYANTFLTPEYTVISGGTEVGDKDVLFRYGHFSKMNKFGLHSLDEEFVYDVSSAEFNPQGLGYAVVVVDTETIELEKVFFFVSEKERLPIRLSLVSDEYIVMQLYPYILIVRDLHCIEEGVYLDLPGECKCSDRYLLIYNVFDDGVNCTLLEPSSKEEYDLLPILAQHNISDDLDFKKSEIQEVNVILCDIVGTTLNISINDIKTVCPKYVLLSNNELPSTYSGSLPQKMNDNNSVDDLPF